VLPTEDSAKTVAWSALKGFVGPQSFEDKWKEYFPSVEVEGKYWVVVFRPIDWEKRDRRLDNNNMIRTTHPDGSEEILFRDPHCGFCAEVKIRRNDAKVRSITFIR
jgi:hypothetical protein